MVTGKRKKKNKESQSVDTKRTAEVNRSLKPSPRIKLSDSPSALYPTVAMSVPTVIISVDPTSLRVGFSSLKPNRRAKE